MGGKQPKQPDYDEAARQGVYADLESYPLRYLTEAASRMGDKVTIDGKTYDFTGLGDTDSAAKMSDQMAQTMLDIQRSSGPAFIKQRIEELKASDPEGYAARKQLFDKIVTDSESNPDRPLAQDLQDSIMGQLQDAGRLNARETEQVQQGVRGGQVARGNFLGNAATAEETGAVVHASDALRDQQQQESLGFLNSGVTPEDVQYRRIQQSLGNLSNFYSGQSPTAQFRSLASAGNGAVPFTGGGPNSQVLDPGAGQRGVNNALGIYSGNVNWANSQVNPWLAGISTGVSAYGAARNLGYGSTTMGPTRTGGGAPGTGGWAWPNGGGW